jgi:hypothetical protein
MQGRCGTMAVNVGDNVIVVNTGRYKAPVSTVGKTGKVTMIDKRNDKCFVHFDDLNNYYGYSLNDIVLEANNE